MTAQQGPLVDPADLPEWMRRLVTATGDLDLSQYRRWVLPERQARAAAVLILLGEQADHGPDVLLQLRADGPGLHSGQVAFPGGAAEPDDPDLVATALREAVEETGLDPAGVRPVALLPELPIPVSNFYVTPVLAHWERPSTVRAVDPAETAAVARVPLATLADPVTRFRVRHPSGAIGPAFGLPGMLVWGFTAGLLTVLLSVGGWERPWNHDDVRDLDQARRQSAEV